MRQVWICLAMVYGFVLSAVFASARADLISGKVLGPDGKPAPQAQVWLQKFDDDSGVEYAAVPLNAAGEFQVEAKASSFSARLFGRILVFQAGFVPTGGNLNKAADKNVYRLQVALPLAGRVLDEKDQPVAGARVSLNNISFGDDPRTMQHVFLIGTPISDKFTTLTDEKGAWTLQGGAENARISIAVGGSRFARTQQQAVVGQETISRLRPGATLSGRVVYEDGRPAVGVAITAQAQSGSFNSSYGANEKSAADGSFFLTGLDDGAYNIFVDAPDENSVAAAIEGAVAQSGQTKALPNLVLTKGALVEGIITDNSGAPIPKVIIGSHGPHRPSSSGAVISATSDEKGFYRLRVAPGKNNVYVMSRPPDFLMPDSGSPSKTLSFEIEADQTKTIPFVLPRGLSVEGEVEGPDGKPVANVSLSLRRADNPDFYSWTNSGATSDDNGHWKATGLTPGKWKIEANDEWSLVSPLEVVVPASVPVHLRVQRTEFFTLRGRVVSFKGEPVAGAALKFAVSVPMGEGSTVSQRTVVSNAQGEYEIGKLKGVEKVRFLSASKPGFRFSKGGALLENPGKWTYSDVVMSPLNAKLAGRVLDVQKQPVPGARVLSPDADPKAVAVTDAEGKFQLENLAQGFVAVLALHPEKGAVLTQQISDGSDVQLELVASSPTPEPDIKRAEELLWEASESGGGDNSWQQGTLWRVLMPHDLQRAAQFATKADGTISEDFISRAIIFLGLRDPGKAAQWGMPRLSELKNDSTRNYTITRLGLAVADENPSLAQELFEQLRAAAPGEGFAAKAHLLYLAQLAAKLKQPDASALVDRALAAGLVEGQDPQSRGYGAMVAEAMAEADAGQALRVIGLLQGDEKSNALRRTVNILARRGGKEEIAAALEMLKLSDSENYSERFGFAGGAAALVPALGKTDPAAALTLARRVQESYYKPQALTQAALVQEDELAKTILREAAAAALNHQAEVAQLSQIAIMTYPRFPELAREFTNQALRLHGESKKEDSLGFIHGQEDDVQNLAIALSQSDPMAARELLELEWAQALEALKASGRQEGGDQTKISRIARAMANIDFNRALQMARAMPPAEANYTSPRLETLRELANWLLASPSERPLLWNVWTARDTPQY